MLKLECQGCGRSERVDGRGKDAPPAQIQATTFDVPGFWGRPGKAEADLCPRCIDRLLATFFGVEPGGRTDRELEADALLGPPTFPTFLEPSGEPVA